MISCALCSGEVKGQRVVEDLQVGSNHVLVEVETEVCEQCGERYYSPELIDHLMDLREGIQAGRTTMTEVGKVYRLTA